jgi:hypothetical protein
MKRMVVFATLAAALSPACFAVDTCVSATLAQYTGSDFSCTVGDRTFSNFTFALGATSSQSLTSSQIQVNPYVSSFGVGGFTFVLLNSQFMGDAGMVAAGQNLDFTVKYQTINAGPSETQVLMSMNGTGGGTGNIDVTKDFCANGGFCTPGSPNYVPGGGVNYGNGPWSGVFPIGTVSSFGVRDRVQVTGGSGFADLNSFDNWYQSVPEPGTWGLLAAGLGFLLYLKRRRATQV